MFERTKRLTKGMKAGLATAEARRLRLAQEAARNALAAAQSRDVDPSLHASRHTPHELKPGQHRASNGVTLADRA